MNVGDVIEGRYVVEQLLGEGGMARVYRVRHLGLGSLHALKVLNPELAARPEVRNRFAAEGQIQAQVRHPNIVAVTEIVAQPDLHGLVMDFVDGPALDDFLAQSPEPPSAEVVKALFAQVLEAMGHAHQAGVVHRDLKPENILIARDAKGRPWPRVTDFGIAKVKQEADSGHATRTGMAMGTRGYMSPEQIKSSRDVTERSDIFSLGATLYELATLKQAFAGDSEYEVMDRIVHEQFLRPEAAHPGIDPAIARAICVALRADPAGRFASCAEFALALEGQFAEPAGPPPPEPLPRPRRPDTAVDPSHAVLDPETFEPLQAGALPETTRTAGPLSLHAVAAPEDTAAWAFERVRAWAADWPPALSKALKRLEVVAEPAFWISASTTFEKRELKARELAFPGGELAPHIVSEPKEVGAWQLGLPGPGPAGEPSQTFVVEGSVLARPCLPCRAKGRKQCLSCLGEGSQRCQACSGTGKISCVLCDGLGTVHRVHSEERERCPSCQGTTVARCLVNACEEGRLHCQDCSGGGSLPCGHCSGKGQLARAITVTRHTRSGSGTALAALELPAEAREALESLDEEGAFAAELQGARPDLARFEPRMEPALAQALARAAGTQPTGIGWQAVHHRVELRRMEVFRVRFSCGPSYQAWVIGTEGRVICLAEPVEDWRAQRLEEAARQAAAGDVLGLQSVAAPGAFQPGDRRVQALGHQLAQVGLQRWGAGSVAEARKLRDLAPPELAGPLREALAEREASLGADLASRQKRQLLFGLLVGAPPAAVLGYALVAEWPLAVGAVLALTALTYVPMQLWLRSRADRALRTRLPLLLGALLPALGTAAAVYLAPPLVSCGLKGQWVGGSAGPSSVEVRFEAGSTVHARVHLSSPAGPEVVDVRGTCDPGSGRFQLRGAQGSLAGTVNADGRALSAAWRGSRGAAGPELPFVRTR